MPSYAVMILGGLHLFAFVVIATVGISFLITGQIPRWLQTEDEKKRLKLKAEGKSDPDDEMGSITRLLHERLRDRSKKTAKAD